MRSLLLFVLLACTGCCTTVEPGYVGIRVNMYDTGHGKGVEQYPLLTGRVWYNPFTETVYEYPTFMQTAKWVETEAISFQSSESTKLTAAISIAYSFQPDSVPELFTEFRKDADTLTETYVRDRVRDAFIRNAGALAATDIMGPRSSELLDAVKADLVGQLGPKGFVIDSISFDGSPVVDPRVTAAINATIEAKQRAIEAETRVKQAEAEANQKREQAKGEADALATMAQAKAEANRRLTESLSPELLQYEALQRWNGILPNVVGGQTVPFIQVPTATGKVASHDR